MIGFHPKRSRPWEHPTEDQMKSAEDAAYSAFHNGHKVFASRTKPAHPKEMIKVTPTESKVESKKKNQRQSLRSKPIDDFLCAFRVNGLECMTTAYEMRHPVRVSVVSGALTTSLPEDVFHLVDTQLTLLHDFLVAKGIATKEEGMEIVVDAVRSMVHSLTYHHSNYRFMFHRDLESSIAFANDLMCMLEKKEGMQSQLSEYFPLLTWEDDEKRGSPTSLVCRELSQLASLYSDDAVNACHRAVNFIMQNIQTSQIATDLFSRDWEDILVQNEVAVSIVKTISDYLGDIEVYVEHDFLYHKIVSSLVRGTVCFYMQSLVKKALAIRRGMKRDFVNRRAQQVAFMNAKRALTRMTYDIEVFRDFFEPLADENSVLSRIITEELFVFVILIECMSLAVGRTQENLDKFILMVHKDISGADSTITRYLLSDIWLLLGDEKECLGIEQEVMRLDVDLQRVSAGVKEQEKTASLSVTRKRMTSNTSLQLNEVLKCLYEDRITEEQPSLCGSMVKGGKLCDDGTSREKGSWETMKRIRRHFTADKYERDLSSMFKQL